MRLTHTVSAAHHQIATRPDQPWANGDRETLARQKRDVNDLCNDKSMYLAQSLSKTQMVQFLYNTQRAFSGIPEGHCSC